MKVNKRIRCIKYALAIVWCAQLLLLGGCSETEESTWKYALSLIDGLKQLGGSYKFLYDGEADREALRHICEGTGTDAKAGRRYPYVNPIEQNVGFLAQKDIVTSRENENPENSVPEELTEELSTALQNKTRLLKLTWQRYLQSMFCCRRMRSCSIYGKILPVCWKAFIMNT